MDIRKLYYKIKGNSSNNIIAGSILAACKNEDTQDQALVACLSRGGLWGITSHALHIFAAIEKSFREETWNEKSLSHINVESMVNSLLLNPANIQLLSTILEDCDLDMAKIQEFALTVLEKMFTLYLSVRSFSFVKDLAVKKDKKKASKKSKSTKKGTETKQGNRYYKIK